MPVDQDPRTDRTDQGTLTVSLGELAGELELPPDSTPASTREPLPSLDLPADRAVVTTRDLAGLVAAARSTSLFHAAGAAGAAAGLLVRRLAMSSRRRVVAITHDVDAARALAADVSFLLGERDASEAEARGEDAGKVLLFVPNEASPYADVNPDRRGAEARLSTLFHLAMDLPWSVLVCPIAALARKVLPRDEVVDHAELIIAEQELDRGALLARLGASGYVRSPLVEDPGTFAVRGALLDVWPPGAERPVRVEFYGDLIMSIKTFEPEDQRTLGEVKEAWLPPAREAILTSANVERARERVRALCDAVDMPSSKARVLVEDVTSGRTFFGSEGYLPAYVDLAPFADYLPEDVTVVLEDPPALTSALRDELGRAAADASEKSRSPHFPLSAFYEAERGVARWLGSRVGVALHRTGVAGGVPGEDSLERFEIAPEETPSLATQDQSDMERAIKAARASRGKHGALDPLVRRVSAWQEAGLKVIIAARAQTQVERLVTLLRHRDLPVRARLGAFDPGLLDGGSTEARDTALVVTGTLARGVVAPAEGLALVTEEEIFGARAHRRAARAASSSTKPARAFLEDLRGLDVGDFVVHVEHGIGRYLGLVHKHVGALTIDLIAVEYAGGDKLYLPVYRLNQIQKFSGGEGTPKVDRLGGQTFAKTKARVEKQLRKMADELLRLYAERRAAHAEGLPPADDEYQAFEATFPFDETADQARAIAEVSADLEAPRPMDRLVCGDVGFGKTEVAIRAAFRAALAGKQVAVLCPTTVLAQQHYLTFKSRMGSYPIELRAMSRFQTKSEQDDTMRRLRDGTVDIVIGTHRLLSKDIHFKRLGLLIVDEEQRFGVTHKERIKALKTNVHVLTLTATPIPRTLQMAVSGLRDMSIITTPPVDRRAIRTIVTRFDEAVLREAVTREIERGGQVFYVYNRVEGLYERAARLAELMPSARVVVAHGQMGEHALEQAMLDFVEGRYDVLCATAIIESGLDIPRANTMIIDRADMFGLSQLYQLRGRVGRSRERAYCYLVVPPPNAMTDESRARIEALERHTELGSGFQIASLDLELRGGGDLLGAEQSGTVASVGFELFCQMLDEAVHELQGHPVVHEVDPELSFDADALLPEDYISDVGVRLTLYKRFAGASSIDEVQELATEMEDRFGPPPVEGRRFVHLMRLKTELRKLRALGCEATSKGVTLHLREDTPLDTTKIMQLMQQKGSPYKVTPDMRLSRRTRESEMFASGLEAADKLLSDLAGCLKDGV
ncbi:transcription-repair coupling factor [Chondromyces crocatus]|uniref:Transcription-repair-coupling factor n=1 Tax=Chondromyces crocatus TaxID=52 RepID=A0A0K1EF70_CHOCO|nr:transcription-repair coupling factor [Chondromyces crocatus]AKT39499.1 transcription-repair coupling factor [Chondromyces crocatus]